MASAPDLPPTTIRWDYPVGGLDPFDISEPRTQRVWEARGWARAFVPGSDVDRQAGDLGAIQPGYKHIALLEKLAVVFQGELLREWPETEQGRYETRRHLAEEAGSRLRDYRNADGLLYKVCDQRLNGSSGEFTHRAEALEFARTAEPGTPTMVYLPMLFTSWH